MDSTAMDKYAHMDFPMFWHLEELRFDGAEALTEAVAKRKSLESGTNMQWRLFATDLVICFEEFRLGNHVRALAALAQCDEDVEGMQASAHPLFAYSPEALLHVVCASRGYILSAMPGLLPKGTSLLDDCFAKFKVRIKRSHFQSALIGIRSEVFMAYGVPGARKAKEYIGEALKIDNTVAEWHFLYAKCLGRLRRIFTYTDTPSEFELKHHELAVSLSQDTVAYYIVYLAQCQREIAFRMGRCAEVDVPLTEKCKLLFDKSVENYNKAKTLAENCCHVLARCALGFLKLPKDPYGNVGEAHEILGTVLDLCPENPMYHHIWALINERGLRDPKTALVFFENTARKNVFVGWKDLIRLTYLEHRDAYNPTPDLVNMLTLFPDAHLKDRILVQIGSFYLFQKNYLFKALEYFMDVFNRDTASQNLTIHHSIFMSLGHPINLLPIIFDECRMKCAHAKTKDFLKKKCKDVVILWAFIYPELSMDKPKDHRKEILHESFLYTHPWARDRGRERHRKVVEKPAKKAKSKSNSSARSKSKGTKIVEKKKEPEFKAYLPDPATILKGWLTEEEQLAKYKGREKWKSAKKRSKEDNSPRRSSTRTQSLGTDKSGRGGGLVGSSWRLDSVSRDPSIEAATRGAPGPRTERRPYSTSRDDSADSRRSSQNTSWRSGSQSPGVAADVDSSPSHRDSSSTRPYQDSSTTRPNWDSRRSSQDTSWRSDSLSPGVAADVDSSQSHRDSSISGYRDSSTTRPYRDSSTTMPHGDASSTKPYRTDYSTPWAHRAEYSRSLSRSSGTRAPPVNWRMEQEAGGTDPARRAIVPESRFFAQEYGSNKASWSNRTGSSVSASDAANAAWPALNSSGSRKPAQHNWRSASLGPSPNRAPPPFLHTNATGDNATGDNATGDNATGDNANDGAGKASPPSPSLRCGTPRS